MRHLREDALKGRSLGTSDLLGAKRGNRIDSRRASRGHIAGHERDRDEQTRDAGKRDGVGRRQIDEHGLENGRRQQRDGEPDGQADERSAACPA